QASYRLARHLERTREVTNTRPKMKLPRPDRRPGQFRFGPRSLRNGLRPRRAFAIESLLLLCAAAVASRHARDVDSDPARLYALILWRRSRGVPGSFITPWQG